MKQFIVLIAVLPIMLFFLLQFTLEYKNSKVIGMVQDIVYTAKEEAKQKGYFSQELIEKIKLDISIAADLDPEEIIVEADQIIRYRYSQGRDRLIYYRVSVPIKRIMAGNKLFGISDEENNYIYTIDSYTASEKI